MSNRKRKHGPPASSTAPTSIRDLDNRLQLLHIQAYEADIRCSSTSARSLEVDGLHVGEALINHSAPDNLTAIWLDRCARQPVPLLQILCVRATYVPRTVADTPVTLYSVCLQSVPFSSSLLLLLWRDPSSLLRPLDTMHVSS